MCTLWQRFGRTARDASEHGCAILLVEAKHFDEEKDKKEANKKWKATNLESGKPRKRRAIASRPKLDLPVPVPSAEEDLETEEPPNELQKEPVSDGGLDKLCGTAYRLARVGKLLPTETVKASKKFKMELAMEDLINADTRGFGCRRRVFQVFFGSGEVCTCLLPQTPV
jgi:hypothetical protein